MKKETIPNEAEMPEIDVEVEGIEESDGVQTEEQEIEIPEISLSDDTEAETTEEEIEEETDEETAAEEVTSDEEDDEEVDEEETPDEEAETKESKTSTSQKEKARKRSRAIRINNVYNAIREQAPSKKGDVNIFAADVQEGVTTGNEKKRDALNEIKISIFDHKPLRGIITGARRMQKKETIVDVLFDGELMVAIPEKQLGLRIDEARTKSQNRSNTHKFTDEERTYMLAKQMIGSKIDFIAKGSTKDEANGGMTIFVGSRVEAMKRKQQRLWFSREARLGEGKEVECDILNVSGTGLYVNCGGFDISIKKSIITNSFNSLSSMYEVGGTVVVKVEKVEGYDESKPTELDNVKLTVSIPERFKVDSSKKLGTMVRGGAYLGEIKSLSDTGDYRISLFNGANARCTIASTRTSIKPRVGDKVSIVFTRVVRDKYYGELASGNITAIVQKAKNM